MSGNFFWHFSTPLKMSSFASFFLMPQCPQLGFGLNSMVGFETRTPKKFRQAYCVVGQPNFLENWDKLHSEVLAKMWVDAKFYRIPATFDHASEALKVPKAVRISPILVRLELQRRGQTLPVCDKIWCPLTFWPKLHCGVCPISPKKIWAGLHCTL